MITRSEYRRIARILRSLGWTEQLTQNRGGTHIGNGGHEHSVWRPPDGGRPVKLGTSRHPRARASTYTDFRRAGVELDPKRQ